MKKVITYILLSSLLAVLLFVVEDEDYVESLFADRVKRSGLQNFGERSVDK